MISQKIQELLSDAFAGDVASIIALVCFSGMYALITLFLLRRLAAREGGIGKKLFWSLVLTVPVLGWMFYLAFYKVPPSQQFR